MFRKILIATVASLALLAPLALPAQSDAHGARTHRTAHRHVHRTGPRHVHHTGIRVYYRTCNREAWRVAGAYGCRADALREVQILRARGNEAFLR